MYIRNKPWGQAHTQMGNKESILGILELVSSETILKAAYHETFINKQEIIKWCQNTTLGFNIRRYHRSRVSFIEKNYERRGSKEVFHPHLIHFCSLHYLTCQQFFKLIFSGYRECLNDEMTIFCFVPIFFIEIKIFTVSKPLFDNMENRSWISKDVVREIGYMATAKFPTGY